MSRFSIGFADELEKVAYQLPSMGQMTSGLGSTSSAPEPTTTPTQQVHVHVHPQGSSKGTAKAKPPAAVPKPPQDVPGESRGATPLVGSAEHVPDIKLTQKDFLPASQRGPAYMAAGVGAPPSFGGHNKTHDYSSSQMAREKPEEPSTGPIITKYMGDTNFTGKYNATVPFGYTHEQLPGNSAPLPSATSPTKATSAPMKPATGVDPSASFKAPAPKKRMFGTPLASNSNRAYQEAE